MVKPVTACPKCGSIDDVVITCTVQRHYELSFKLTDLAVPYAEQDVTSYGDDDTDPALYEARCKKCNYHFTRDELYRISCYSENMDYDEDCCYVDECDNCEASQRRVDWSLFCPKKGEIVSGNSICDDYKEYEGREK